MDPGGQRSGRERDAWASERVYRALTRAYPEEVRRRYAGEMVGYFGDLCREEWHSRGPRGLASLWARTLPEVLFTALQERGVLFRRSAYLPLDAGTVQRLGALCALLGGIMGVSFPLIGPLLVALGNLTGYHSYGSGPLVQLFWLSLLLGALSLSSLGLFGLYGAVVARSGEARPGLLAGAGAVFAAAAASLWLSIGGFVIANQLASGTPLSALFEWVWYVGAILMGPSILCWFVGLLLLGTAAALRPLPRRLRVSPLALFALIATTYEFGSHFFTVDSPLTLARGLPFAFVAILGWILLDEDLGAGPLAATDGPTGSADAATRAAGGQSAGVARFDASGAEGEKEKELLRAVRRYGRLTVAGVAMETSLSVAEADRMLSELTGKGHLEVRVERGRLLYSLWGDRG